ncbi:MAG: lamin tail domain-containing protein [Phycisphaeraceae bacterium]|nr:lamin tail domain-containing protein [Phycisphaeraceae bacterium]
MRTLSAVTVLLIAAPAFAADIIISEIMYNPASREAKPGGDQAISCRTEWVEIYNVSQAEVDLSGWALADEDGSTGPIAESTIIAPGVAVVLIPQECGIDNFRAAWGEGFQVIPVSGWGDGGLRNLSNSPHENNEILRLVDKDGTDIDTVNYDDEGDWPKDVPDGPSIYLKPDALNHEANDSGGNWARSAVDSDGGKANVKTDIFDGDDVGSPGAVNKASE